MSRRSALSSLVVSTSVLALAVPAQASGPEFLDNTGFYKSRAQTYAATHEVSRGGWGLDYRGMSAHDPAHTRVRRLSEQEQRAFVAPRGDVSSRTKAYINHHARALGIEDFESGGLELVASHTLSDGATIVQLRQRVQGVEVFGPQLSLLLDPQGRLVTVSGSLHTQLRVLKGERKAFARTDEAVTADVLGATLRKSVSTLQWSGSAKDGGYTLYNIDRQSRSLGLGDVVRTKPLYIPTAEGLVAAYFVEYSEGSGASEQGTMVVARAEDSRVLFKKGLTMSDSFKYRVWVHDDARKTPLDNPLVDFTPHPKGTPDSAKPGVPAKTTLVEMEGFNTNPDKKSDPWLPAGATETKGNNVDAYTDRDHVKDPETKKDTNDGFNEGDLRAKVSSPGVFDYTYDLNKEPGSTEEQKMASVTQIFYTNNWLHDYWYDLGMDEKSGNAQMDNYGRGGKDSDPLLAQAQDQADSGARNNANITVFGDGRSPRMQMYLWSDKDKVRSVTPTKEIPGFKPDEVGSANYGKQNFSIKAPVVLVEDTEAPFDDGCQVPKDPASVKGKIVLVKIGFKPGEEATCMSIQRASILQEAGAVGMIFMDNTERIPNLGGEWPKEVTLPALSINVKNRDLLLKAMEAGEVEITMAREKSADIDGTIDNQVVAHEWGHYAHLRLVRTGGIVGIGMSEGFADYFALHMSMREGDDFKAVYPLATYVSSGRTVDPFYFGLRRYPYSVNKKINPLMFNHVADGEALPSPDDIPQQVSGQPNSEVHNSGEFFAQTLMDVEYELHQANKKKDKPLSWDGVHRLMGEYLIAGMKLTPAQPTWTEQRDAILAVALARNKQDYDAMVKGFAGRGMGTCAVSPAADSKDNVGAASSVEVTGLTSFTGWALDDSQSSCDQDGYLDVNERGHLTVNVRNIGMDLAKTSKVELKSKDEALVVDATGPLPVGDLDINKEGVVKVPVRLVKAPKKGSTLAVEIIVTDENSCKKTFTIEVKPRVDLDEVPNSTNLETFESNRGLWTTVKMDDAPQDTWEWIAETADDQSNFVWRGRDLAVLSDSSLISPAFEVKADEDFAIEFEHAYSFEASEHEEKMVNWDGGLIEYTEDDGKTWKDIKDVVVNPEFNGVIGVVEDSKNPLSGRNGYVGTSPGYPARSLVRLDFQRKVAGKVIKIRFRIGTDAASGAPGWIIDNLRVTGVAKKPFTNVIADACDTQPGEDTGGETGGGTGGKDGTGGTDSTGGSTGTGGGGNGDQPVQPTPVGCGCSSASEGDTGFFAGLALLGLGLFRRRKDKGAQG